MNLVTQSNKIACRVALKRLVEEGVIEHHGPRRGCYRRALNDCPALDWRNAPTDPLDIALPICIEEYVAIMPGNLIVLAGEPNARFSAARYRTYMTYDCFHPVRQLLL